MRLQQASQEEFMMEESKTVSSNSLQTLGRWLIGKMDWNQLCMNPVASTVALNSLRNHSLECRVLFWLHYNPQYAHGHFSEDCKVAL